jgi:hypothetical protein
MNVKKENKEKSHQKRTLVPDLRASGHKSLYLIGQCDSDTLSVAGRVSSPHI